MGGERAPWNLIEKACSSKVNVVHFSHADWDHVGLLKSVIRKLKKICLKTPPAGPITEQRIHWLSIIASCNSDKALSKSRSNLIKLIYSGEKAARKNKVSGNESSNIFLMDGRILLPGDSTKKAELKWSRRATIRSTKILVLGHHGSRTSTSAKLLDALPLLRQAVVSARQAKYGHPHSSVLFQLKQRGIAVLKTEDWGTIHFQKSMSGQ
jgi:competence protein ComEC